MSEALEAGDAPEVTDLAPEAGAEAGQPDAAHDATGDTDEIEAEALAMGWKPLSQFKGPKDKFVSAADYVERGKTIMPFLRKELQQAYKKIEGLETAVQNAVKHISKADQRAYQQARADLEAELTQAAQNGDAETVKAVTKDIVDLEKGVIADAKAESPDDPEWFAAWKAENDWFGKDKARSAAAAAFAEEAMSEGYSDRALAKEVDRRLREEFPHKYAKPENPNRKLPGAVEGAGAPIRRNGKSFSDLPPDAQAMCLSFEKDIKGFKRETYVKDYFAQ